MIRTASQKLKRVVVNLQKSKGNYVVDHRGEKYLDLHSNIASLPLGYNHPDLVAFSQRPEVQSLLIHRQATNFYPSLEHKQQLLDVYPLISPFPDAFLHLTSSGSEAVENAIKFCTRSRNNPGKVLSFSGGFHGRTIGALSVTKTNPNYSEGFPSIGTCQAYFPHGKSERECIEEFSRILETDNDISCVIIEPIQSEGGDRFASPSFFRSIRDISLHHDKPFIVDEIQTGLGTGKLWAHEHWDLTTPPDIVLFSKKLQVSGLFVKPEIAPKASDLLVYNSTWAGDALRGATLGQILKVVDRDELLDKSRITGEYFFDGLREISGIRNVRNLGSFGGFDVDYPEFFIKKSQDKNLLLSMCGSDSIRVRPSLMFRQHDARIALNIIREVLLS